ncbi:Transcription factor [Nymphaea thermarum]|nr:Transcription factor [Nymphaea thermarum]
MALITTKRVNKRKSSFSARARRIKQAADISLASAAMACNSKHAWSKAVIRRSHATLRHHRLLRQPQAAAAVPMKEFRRPSRADALRRLMPGGRGMGFCRLLEEAADYIRALKAQVQVMQCIADSLDP